MQRPCGRSRQGAQLAYRLAEVLRLSVGHKEAEAGRSPIQAQLLSKTLSEEQCTWVAQLTELEGGQSGLEQLRPKSGTWGGLEA